MVEGIFTVDTSLPLKLWRILLKQCKLTLNIIIASFVYSQLSSHTHVWYIWLQCHINAPPRYQIGQACETVRRRLMGTPWIIRVVHRPYKRKLKVPKICTQQRQIKLQLLIQQSYYLHTKIFLNHHRPMQKQM